VNAAHDGDTIAVGAGTFSGGITIDKGVRVQCAGCDKTIIKGGGPVVTIFRAASPDALSVSIDGVTITGGVNDSQPDPEVTFGGGVWIPTSQLDHPPFNGTGATVSISSSVITGNTVNVRKRRRSPTSLRRRPERLRRRDLERRPGHPVGDADLDRQRRQCEPPQWERRLPPQRRGRLHRLRDRAHARGDRRQQARRLLRLLT